VECPSRWMRGTRPPRIDTVMRRLQTHSKLDGEQIVRSKADSFCGKLDERISERQIWVKPRLTRLVAGAAEAGGSSANPDGGATFS
jgi:hypothetical protein